MDDSRKIISQALFSLMIIISLTVIGYTVKARAGPLLTTTDLSGVVLDNTGQGVSEATVFVRGPTMIYSLVTDNQGRWLTSGVTTGDYQIYAINPNGVAWNAPRQLSLTAPEDVTLTLDAPDNVIQAADFEASNVWQVWQRFNGEITLSTAAFDGQGAARLGHLPGKALVCFQNNQPGQLWSIKQTVTVPNDERPFLSFLSQIETSQTAFDYAWLELVLLVDGQPNYLIPWGELWQASDWQLRSYDLSAWRGQTVELLFQVANCGPESFEVTIDRVSLGTQVPNSNPLPTPTVSPITTVTPDATPAPGSTPTPIHTPANPNADYVATARQLTACENQGKHHLFIYVEDAAGNGIPDVELRVYWPDGEAILVTGRKGEHPGLVDFPMFKGNYWIEVLDGSSDVVGPLTPDIPRDELCEETGNPVGNSLFHYSYEVIFTQR